MPEELPAQSRKRVASDANAPDSPKRTCRNNGWRRAAKRLDACQNENERLKNEIEALRQGQVPDGDSQTASQPLAHDLEPCLGATAHEELDDVLKKLGNYDMLDDAGKQAVIRHVKMKMVHCYNVENVCTLSSTETAY